MKVSFAQEEHFVEYFQKLMFAFIQTFDFDGNLSFNQLAF
jgi:hypothetical protein